MTPQQLEAHSETLKIARLLDSTAEELSFLTELPPDELRVFREQVTSTLFDAHHGVLQRMAAASKLLPTPVLAKIAERVFGPLLCARMAGLVETSRGVDVATRLSPSFLADVAAELDPRRASDIITRIPTALVRGVAAELVRRADWIAIGQFVDNLPSPALRAGLDEIDDAALLRIAFVLDHKDNMDDLVDLLDQERLTGIVRQAAYTHQWLAAFDLLAHLGNRNAERLVTAFDTLDARTRAEAAKTAREHGFHERLDSLLTGLDP